MSRIYVIHENDAWVEPLRVAFAELRLPFTEWFIAEGKLDLDRNADYGFEQVKTNHGHSSHPDITSLFRAPVPFRGKSAMLLSASNGQVGGIRGLWQLRIPLEGLGVLIHPDMYTLPWADKAFGPDGRLIEAERQDRLASMVRSYVAVARKLAAE